MQVGQSPCLSRAEGREELGRRGADAAVMAKAMEAILAMRMAREDRFIIVEPIGL